MALNRQNDCLQILINLGLTPLQAKTYLFLAKIEEADVATISETSDIAREEIYRTMPKLEETGLVEKIIGRPTRYKPLPLKDGLTMLIQKRRDENTNLEKTTKALITSLNHNDLLESACQEESSKFVITSELRLFRKRLENCMDKAEKEIAVVASQEVIMGMIYNHLKSLQKAMEKGVRIRILTNKIKEKGNPEEIFSLDQNRLFRFKDPFTVVPVTMALFDQKEVNIRLTDELVPSLWSNNPEIVKLSVSYFNEIWDKK